ncbi:MAG: glycosyltransferase [Candidatus Peregrinibacteria bacterium]|nr:glycosyltransferase [Candidatus Peregrinibacteria bacterium]
MSWLIAFFTISGVSFTFWCTVGLVRFFTESVLPPKKRGRYPRVSPDRVAAIVPAHNEELCIARTLRALKKVVPRTHIFVGSDASTDRTADIVVREGCHVLEINPNKGKAGVLVTLIGQFRIVERFDAMIIVDADTELDSHYLENALPYFDDPQVVAVAGHAVTRWEPHTFPRWPYFFTAYRVRLYCVLQALMRYAQTWKYTNVTSIVPGFASMYRTHVLPKIDIAAKGMIIEDFNMTFELQKKKLGKVAYHPSIFGTCQDPFTFRDYVKQVKRWNLGFWQTVRRHGVWPSFFWLALGLFLIEMFIYSFFLLGLPLFLIGFLFTGFAPIEVPFPEGIPLELTLNFQDLFMGVFVMDYALTVIVAVFERKPLLLVYGLGFLVLRYIDVFLYVLTFPLAFIVKSTGQWKSPARKG